MSILLNLILIILAILGVADSGYITYEKWANVPSICQNIPGFDCGAVLNSPWAYIGPIPLSVLGFLFYSFILSVAVYHLITVRPNPLVKHLLLLSTSFGFLFSLFLVYLQAVVIGAFCLFCMISAGTSTLIFLTSIGFWWERKKIDAANDDHTEESI